jgi:hypothetical protein
VTFGLTVLSDGNKILGECNVYDGALRQHLTCDTITQFAQIGNIAILSGSATVGGARTDFTIEVEDNGESGVGKDAFSIETSDGYVRSGVLTQGDIQVGHSKGSAFSLP